MRGVKEDEESADDECKFELYSNETPYHNLNVTSTGKGEVWGFLVLFL